MKLLSRVGILPVGGLYGYFSRSSRLRSLVLATPASFVKVSIDETEDEEVDVMRRTALVGSFLLLSALWVVPPVEAQTTTTTGTVQKLGPFTYYSLRGSDGTSTTGTSNRLGSFEYYDLRSSGTTQSGFTSTSTRGTSQELGPFTYYDFTSTGTEAGRYGTETTTGTSQKLGPFTYFDFQSSDGSSVSGTVQTLGTTDYWSLTETDPFGSPSDD